MPKRPRGLERLEAPRATSPQRRKPPPSTLALAGIVRWFRSALRARGGEAEAAPLDAAERQRLAHRKRVAEREIRRLDKTLKRIGCSTCIEQAPSRDAIRLERTASALRAELAAIEKRLASG